MATVSWKSGVSGNWNTDPSDWSTGSAPAAGDDAIIAASGGYTVSITGQINPVASITLSDTSATLAIADPGGTETVTGGLTNSGAVDVDSGGPGGTTLSIGGTLTDTNFIQIGNSGISS